MTAADSDDELYARPMPKKLKTGKEQTTMDGFLASAASRTTAKAKASSKKVVGPKGKKKAVDSDDEDSFPASDGEESQVAVPPPKLRAARTAAVKKPATYIDPSDDEEDAEVKPRGDDKSFAESD